MSTVEVDICNSALIKLGAEPINDLSDDSKEARLCRLQFPKIRDAVLRSAPWSFAMKRITLDHLAGQTLEFGDGNIFQIPINVVRIWKTYDGSPRYAYTIEEDKFIANVDVAQVWAVINTVQPAYWRADFKEALACQLAADICYSMTNSNTLKAGLVQEAELWVQRARSTGSQEVTPEDFRFDEFLNSRRGGRAFYE
jgi:hypothetical protein